MKNMEQRAIGLAVDTVGSYGREVIHGVMEFCHRNPHWLIAVEPRTWVYTKNQEPEDWKVDGLIVQAYSQDVVDRVRALKIPAINVSNTGRCERQLPTIIPDDHAIGLMAADYLLTLGVQHYGFCGSSRAEYSVIRGAAFIQRMTEAGITVDECDNLVPHLDAWLASVPKPVAIFCCNDYWAHRTLSAARRGGFHVPDQIAVLGVDDDELLNTIGALPMSSIAIPATKIGYEAAVMLEAALNGEPPPQRTLLPPLCVVPRATTDVANVDDPEVAMAMRHIKANVARPIQVDDVLEHLSMSRRSLERRFRTALGRSIALEIRRAHIERAKQLLSNTTLSIEEVAKASGFTSSTLLGVVFRRYVGESPTTFRQRSKCGTPLKSVKAVTPVR
jgi:LacI family transcriptional regulator